MISNDDYRVVLAQARERLTLIEPDIIVCKLRDRRRERRCVLSLAERRPHVALCPDYRSRLDHPLARADLLNAGADAIAAKPINAAELRAMVYAAMRMRPQYQSLMCEDQAGS
jgi:AmiR/NasT family two-component response regulator